MPELPQSTARIEECLERLRQGDVTAREELIANTCDQLQRLTRKMLRDFPRVKRWEETDDVFQAAVMRLCRALESVELTDSRQYFRLAAVQIRRQLHDLARHYFGPQGQGVKHQTQPVDASQSGLTPRHEAGSVTQDPRRIVEWSEFHEKVDELPDREREVFEMLWYDGLSHADAARVLGVSTKTVQRAWIESRLMLQKALGGVPIE